MMGAAMPPSAKPLHLHIIHKSIELVMTAHDIPQRLPTYSHFCQDSVHEGAWAHVLFTHSHVHPQVPWMGSPTRMMHADSP